MGSCSWALLKKGSYSFRWIQLMAECGSVSTGAPWPSGGFPTAAALQLFLHFQRAQISSHGLVSPQQRQLPLILPFGGSWGHSMHCRIREFTSLLHGFQENMFISTRRRPHRARSCKRLRESSLVARQAPAEVVLTTQLFMMIPPNGNISQQSYSRSGWDFWAQPARPVAATWTTKKLFTDWQ